MMRAGGLPLAPPLEQLRSVSALGFGWFVVGMVLHMILRFARCYFLLVPIAPIPLRRVMTINAIALALLTYLPLRIGEVARPAMLRDKGHLSAWAVTGTVGAERVIDGLLFSIMLLLGLAIATPQSPLPDHIGSLPVPASLIPAAARLTGVVFFVAFFIMTGFYFFRETARRITERVIGVVSQDFAAKVANAVSALSDGLRFLTNPRFALPFLLISILSTASEIWGVQMLAHAVGLPDVNFTQATVLIGVLAIGFVMPNAPGFFGTVQLALYAGLAIYLAPDHVAREGGVFVFLFYVTYVAIVVAQAGLALLVEYMAPSAPQSAALGSSS
jgi:glycosyltransferase 2 family protein